jgi:site-specific DNA-cytosine methylase
MICPHQGQLGKKHRPGLRRIEAEILLAGYPYPYKVLNAADYGVASIRKRIMLVAAGPKMSLPSWPEPTHGDGLLPLVTVRDAIVDLEWRNPRMQNTSNANGPHKSSSDKSDYCAIPDGSGANASAYAKGLMSPNAKVIANHNTGWQPKMDNWEDSKSIAKYDYPCGSTFLLAY